MTAPTMLPFAAQLSLSRKTLIVSHRVTRRSHLIVSNAVLPDRKQKNGSPTAAAVLFHVKRYPHICTNSCTLAGSFALSRVAPAKKVTPASSAKESASAVTRLHRFICILLSCLLPLLYPAICDSDEKTVNNLLQFPAKKHDFSSFDSCILFFIIV